MRFDRIFVRESELENVVAKSFNLIGIEKVSYSILSKRAVWVFNTKKYSIYINRYLERKHSHLIIGDSWQYLISNPTKNVLLH